MDARAATMADELSQLLAGTPGFYADPGGYARGLAEIERHIAAAGGRLQKGSPHSFCLIHGLRATATAGPSEAVRNWVAQVRRKAGQP